MAPPPQKQTIDQAEWDRRLAEAEVLKSDMDRLVMQYLVSEGYKEAAEQFANETSINPEVELSTIGERMAIRNAIQDGHIPLAIEKVNDLNPELLDNNPSLYFQLKLQYLVELIRGGEVKEALELVQEEIAPLCEESAELLSELESVLALLAFQPPPSESQAAPAAAAAAAAPSAAGGHIPEAIRQLWEPMQRFRVASRVNTAILTSQGQDKEARLLFLLKMLVWAQEQLSEHATFPRIHDLLAAAPAQSGSA